uniref:IRG-type G domain-containing protein n=1 Tax=Chelydra serpentina TaxID=8475 RepID=A0A8C3TFE7_CHESE
MMYDSKSHWADLISKWGSELNTKLNIAITGDPGSGKSSFINAIRSLNDDDDDRGAAKTSVKEMTNKPAPYPHHMHPNVTMWDLPGIGTANCPAETYLKDMNFDRYDFFIIVAAVRFTEADTKLAKEIKKMGKKFYFVRTKVDVDLANEQRKRDFNEEKTLQIIRSDCMEQVCPHCALTLGSNSDLSLNPCCFHSQISLTRVSEH